MFSDIGSASNRDDTNPLEEPGWPVRPSQEVRQEASFDHHFAVATQHQLVDPGQRSFDFGAQNLRRLVEGLRAPPVVIYARACQFGRLNVRLATRKRWSL
jgi:hypothetical protein